ncbi:CmcJ/NvfI family oxidoreductase [Hydrogenophaga crocea]|uniref:Methyltransferase n=1 Tax=Hydrogenophaga crocea TaxID=2716225 RepID=A0A6G8IF89_9BURK|nr:CmcJ/NvfI family oxidoreductase [Hydrogenophaga crocea]QIM51728.1 methyltransferase [Hydrogenophaga crocea]
MHQPVAEPTVSVRAQVGYLDEFASKPEIYLCQPPRGVEAENCSTDLRWVDIEDVRSRDRMPTLEHDGFMFMRDGLPDIDFRDPEQVKARYYPVIAQLALQATGGQSAFVFDHLVRQRDPGMNLHRFGERGADVKVGALGRVHNDYSEESGRRRLALVMDSLGLDQRPRRYCIVNLWRSIGGVIEDSPLAFCAAQSVSTQDLVAAKLHYGHRTGEIYLLRFNPGHRWYHLDAMDTHDVAVFKQFDSRVSGVSRFVPHSAFDLPQAKSAKSRRRSVEARVLVVME